MSFPYKLVRPITSISALSISTILLMHLSTKFQDQISPAITYSHHGSPGCPKTQSKITKALRQDRAQQHERTPKALREIQRGYLLVNGSSQKNEDILDIKREKGETKPWVTPAYKKYHQQWTGRREEMQNYDAKDNPWLQLPSGTPHKVFSFLNAWGPWVSLTQNISSSLVCKTGERQG